jgi:hypothetical protein
VVNPHDLGFGHGLLDMTPKTWAEKIDKLALMKIINFVYQRTLSRNWKTTYRMVKKPENHICDKDLISRIF